MMINHKRKLIRETSFFKRSLLSLLSLGVVFSNMIHYIAHAPGTIKPTLAANPNIEENYLQLDWEVNNQSEPYTYQIYQKRYGSEEYQSISTTDLDTGEVV